MVLSGASGWRLREAPLFNRAQSASFWGMQQRSVQNCLDFDFVCSRREPSVVAIAAITTRSTTGATTRSSFLSTSKCLTQCANIPDASVMVNFASLRSAYDSTLEALQFPQIRVIAIIAEGIPENLSRRLALRAAEKSVTRHRAGHCPAPWPYVSRSGGMSNELNNIIALECRRRVLEGVAIGGDRDIPDSTFLDHLLRYQADPGAQMLVVLGEVGRSRGIGALPTPCADGRITKPMVAWCIGTCAGLLGSEVQFGHAGACANSGQETASAKNAALAAAGAHVPASFDQLGETIRASTKIWSAAASLLPKEEPAPPTVPMDYSWARELGLIRKPQLVHDVNLRLSAARSCCTPGVPITEIINRDFGIGGRITAPRSQALTTPSLCARAGKDLIRRRSATAPPKQFSHGVDTGLIPMEFVNEMRKRVELIMGIGHRVKSINNPDMRVEILKKFALENFPASPMLHYALEVEKITTSKKPNLILNVDGMIGVAYADEFIEIGALNGMFVLGRSMGFIGHYLDQRRLKQGLYRHPWDDISYVMPEQSQWAPW
uniref:ATP citrate synthase n=1 Tax=Macrostomum lignano TaxID=282301 RepID=A0A1I8F927_9PLAT